MDRTCTHENTDYIKAFDPFEIYLCNECGGLIDIADKASGFGNRALTADEIGDRIGDLLLPLKNKLADIAEIVKC